MHPDNTLALVAYSAFAATTFANGGGEGYDQVLEPFEKLTEHEQCAWRSAANAVASETKRTIRVALGIYGT